jgi:hypothetical protein
VHGLNVWACVCLTERCTAFVPADAAQMVDKGSIVACRVQQGSDVWARVSLTGPCKALHACMSTWCRQRREPGRAMAHRLTLCASAARAGTASTSTAGNNPPSRTKGVKNKPAIDTCVWSWERRCMVSLAAALHNRSCTAMRCDRCHAMHYRKKSNAKV